MKYAIVQSISRRWVWVGAVLLLGACGEIAAPGEDIPTLSADLKDAPAGTLRQASEVPRLVTYDTTFTVTQGRANVLNVCYEDAEPPCSSADTLNTGVEDVSSWFLKVLFRQSTQFIDPAGVPLAWGDTLRITLSIDSTAFLATFGPQGLVFEGPMRPKLSFRYTLADLTNTDPSDLRIWYQATSGEEWLAQLSEVKLEYDAVSMDLSHFSNYALAF